jgi:hypothetical protein
MKINSYEECVKAYGNSDAALLGIAKESPYPDFPYTLLVEGYFLEFDELQKWLVNNFGEPYSENNKIVGAVWRGQAYPKIDYEYAFVQYYFKEKKDYELFEKTVTETYTTGPKGKWKSDGFNKFIKQEVSG